MLAQGLFFPSTTGSCAGFTVVGVVSFFAFFFQAHSPSTDDQEDADDEEEAFASSVFSSSGAETGWGDGGGMAVEAMGVTL